MRLQLHSCIALLLLAGCGNPSVENNDIAVYPTEPIDLPEPPPPQPVENATAINSPDPDVEIYLCPDQPPAAPTTAPGPLAGTHYPPAPKFCERKRQRPESPASVGTKADADVVRAVKSDKLLTNPANRQP